MRINFFLKEEETAIFLKLFNKFSQIIILSLYDDNNKSKAVGNIETIDDTLLAQHGCDNFDQYRVDPTKDLIPDFFVPTDDTPPESLKAQKEEE